MIKKHSFIISIFLIFTVIPFYFLAYPSLLGEINIQAYSDALTYERLAKENYSQLTSISFSLLGPITILKFFSYNYTLIYIFNCIIFFVSIKLLFKYYDLKYKIFLFFILVNPMTLFALFSVNKEILLFLDIVLLLIFLKNKNILLFIFITIFSYFIKWQMLLFVLVASGIFLCEKIYKNRILYVVFFLLSLSILFPMISGMFQEVLDVSKLDTDKVSGSGIFPKLIELQTQFGGYIVAFPLKMMQFLFGLIGRSYLILDWNDFWNNFVQTIFSFSFFFLIIYLIFKKRINFQNDVFYLSIIFSLIFALSPIFSIRYFYPLYIMLSVVVSQKLKLKK